MRPSAFPDVVVLVVRERQDLFEERAQPGRRLRHIQRVHRDPSAYRLRLTCPSRMAVTSSCPSPLRVSAYAAVPITQGLQMPECARKWSGESLG
jgi:hypothetical protein